MEYPFVSIVAANWNGGEKIIRCMKSVAELDYPSYEIILVDNGSSDGSKEKIKKFFEKNKNFTIIENYENLGCVKAINQGFEKAKGDFVFRLDDDIVLQKDSLKKLAEVLIKNPDIGVVIPKVYYYSEKNVFCNLGFSINPITGKTKAIGLNEEDRGQYEESLDVDYVPGAVLLTRKEVIQKVGKLDEDYFVYYEDADWCSRVKKAGYRVVYAPVTKAWHDCKKYSDLTTFRIHHYTKSKTLFMKKNNSVMQNMFFFPFFLIGYTPAKLLGFTLNGKTSLISSYITGIKEGLFPKRS